MGSEKEEKNSKKKKENILQVFLLSLERKDSQTFKSSSYKNLFIQCVCCWYDLLQQMFFIPYDN